MIEALLHPRVVPLLLGVSALLASAPLDAQTGAQLAAVDRYARAELERQQIPGMSVAVVHGGRIILARGYGFANLEHRVPASDSTVYQSGSVGKQFTAALLTMLAGEGRLRLDDPVRRYLPEGPATWDGITLRHLLTHTSGIPDYTDDAIDYRRDYTEEDLLRLAAGLTPEFPPGARWSYSNTGYVLLGIVVRRVTGRFYGDELADRLFRPLGMRTARIITEAAIVPHRSGGYRRVEGRLEHHEWVAPSLNTTADGSLYLTVRDLAQWALALDRAKVPGAGVHGESWTPVRLRDGGTYPYGLGWDLAEQRGLRRIGHGGSWQGFRASFQRYPEQDLTVIVLANLAQAEPEAISFGIAGRLAPALRPPHEVDAPGRPVTPVREIVAAMAAGNPDSAVSAELRAFLSSDAREALTGLTAHGARWTDAGCDEVGGRGLERLGLRLARLCYARVALRDEQKLVEVSLDAAGQAVTVDWYDY